MKLIRLRMLIEKHVIISDYNSDFFAFTEILVYCRCGVWCHHITVISTLCPPLAEKYGKTDIFKVRSTSVLYKCDMWSKSQQHFFVLNGAYSEWKSLRRYLKFLQMEYHNESTKLWGGAYSNLNAREGAYLKGDAYSKLNLI